MAGVLQGSGHLADFLRARDLVSTEVVRKLFTCGGKSAKFSILLKNGVNEDCNGGLLGQVVKLLNCNL